MRSVAYRKAEGSWCKTDPPRAVHSQCRFSRAADSHEFDVHFLQSATVARSPSVAVVTWATNVKGLPSNKRINATHCAASRRLLAQASRRCSRARYAQR